MCFRLNACCFPVSKKGHFCQVIAVPAPAWPSEEWPPLCTANGPWVSSCVTCAWAPQHPHLQLGDALWQERQGLSPQRHQRSCCAVWPSPPATTLGVRCHVPGCITGAPGLAAGWRREACAPAFGRQSPPQIISDDFYSFVFYFIWCLYILSSQIPNSTGNRIVFEGKYREQWKLSLPSNLRY